MSSQRSLSILLIITIVLFFINIFFEAPGGKGNSSSSSMAGGPQVIVVPIDGIISGETSGFVLDSLRRIATMNGVRGVILKINSPGGTTGTSEEIYNEVMNLRKTGIKVVASIADVGASGGYYIASAADIIVANASSLTGSIGVIMSTMNFKGIADKFGVKSINFVSGKMKDMLSPFRDIRPDEEEYIRSMITTIYNQFVNSVLAGRNSVQQKITKENLLTLADGRVFTGMDAKEKGLVDVLGGFSVAKEQMQNLLHTDTVSLKLLTKNSFSQIVTALMDGTRNIADNMNPLSKVSGGTFLREHLDMPLYYTNLGGM